MLYPTFCRILAGEKSDAHSHFESELFFIISGDGLIIINNESQPVHLGDLIRIPSFANHVIHNTGKNDLTFLSIYSEEVVIAPLPHTTLITSAPPTPNGSLHLGHISGPYLASDIMTRYLRLRSLNVLNCSGTDDHQNYVLEKAHSLKIKTEDFRKDMRRRIQKGLETFHIELDQFIEPKVDEIYQNRILDFVQRAIKSGIVELEDYEFPYCTRCKHTLVDSLLNAFCPYCSEPSRGACEQCGIVVPPHHLCHITCSRCNQPAEKKHTSVYTFDLCKYLPLIQNDLAQLALSPNLKNLISRVTCINPLKIILTHPNELEYGIRLPRTNQTIHVWFEMAAHYEQFALGQEYWVHCFGFDNSFYYLLFIPSLLRAINQHAKLPNQVVSNEFLLLDELKFSTSSNHAIWADQFSGNIDHLRLFLTLYRPSTQATNFSLEQFQKFSADLKRQLEHLNERAHVVTKQKTHINPQQLIEGNRVTRDMERFLSPTLYDLRRASRHLISFMDYAQQTIGTDSNERLMLHILATLMMPFMPNESKHLFDSLDEYSRTWTNDWSTLYEIV